MEIKSSIQFYNGITTDEIQETLIKAAADLITEDTPNYQWVAGRLINYHLRKQVYNDFEPDHLARVIENIECSNVALDELDSNFRYNDAVIRNMVVRMKAPETGDSPVKAAYFSFKIY